MPIIVNRSTHAVLAMSFTVVSVSTTPPRVRWKKGGGSLGVIGDPGEELFIVAASFGSSSRPARTVSVTHGSKSELLFRPKVLYNQNACSDTQEPGEQ